MEILVGLVIVIVMLFVLGVPDFYIVLGFMGLMVLSLALTLVFFAWTAFTLIGSKRVKARFLRIDKPEKGFSSAVYEIAEGEKRNTFPCEMIFRSFLYKPEKDVMVRMTKRGKVYDRYSVITVATGLVLGAASLYIVSGYIITIVNDIFVSRR